MEWRELIDRLFNTFLKFLLKFIRRKTFANFILKALRLVLGVMCDTYYEWDEKTERKWISNKLFNRFFKIFLTFFLWFWTIQTIKLNVFIRLLFQFYTCSWVLIWNQNVVKVEIVLLIKFFCRFLKKLKTNKWAKEKFNRRFERNKIMNGQNETVCLVIAKFLSNKWYLLEERTFF